MSYQNSYKYTHRFLERNKGALTNCTGHSMATRLDHPDQKHLTISCQTMPYRMPAITTSEEIIIGVLSGAGGEGPGRRKAIRETWAHGHSVYFIVAGPWVNIQSEYEEYHDLIWLDRDEIYDKDNSVLPYKTMLFMKIAHDSATSQNLNIKFAFKTDDDSFVNVKYLHQYLLEASIVRDYWGTCHHELVPPFRGDGWKWSVSHEVYPEEWYPPYCQGAGFGLSLKFLTCAVKGGEGSHIANHRYMPFVSLLAFYILQICLIGVKLNTIGVLVLPFRL